MKSIFGHVYYSSTHSSIKTLQYTFLTVWFSRFDVWFWTFILTFWHTVLLQDNRQNKLDKPIWWWDLVYDGCGFFAYRPQFKPFISMQKCEILDKITWNPYFTSKGKSVKFKNYCNNVYRKEINCGMYTLGS